MTDYSFSGQTVMGTGASGNLGRSVTKMFMDSGANLVLIDHSKEKLNRVFPEVIRSDKHLAAQGIDINIEQLLILLPKG